MPEGDTIFRTAAALHRALAGHRITRFDAAFAQLVRVDEDAPVTGREVARCESAGKHVLLWLTGDLILRTHMRMSGSWHLYRHGEAWQRPAHDMRIRIDTEAWVAVAFLVPVAEFVRTRDLARHRELSRLGPDLLSATFDRDAALERLAADTRPVADAVLDQRVVAGIGNVFKSEVLFLCGIPPHRTAASLTPDQRAAIVDTAVALMRANTGSNAGPGIATYRGLRRTTRHARPDENLWVYGRAGKPCRKCGAAIAVSRDGAYTRPSYWCPTCQGSGTTNANPQQFSRTPRRQT